MPKPKSVQPLSDEGILLAHLELKIDASSGRPSVKALALCPDCKAVHSFMWPLKPGDEGAAVREKPSQCKSTSPNGRRATVRVALDSALAESNAEVVDEFTEALAAYERQQASEAADRAAKRAARAPGRTPKSPR